MASMKSTMGEPTLVIEKRRPHRITATTSAVYRRVVRASGCFADGLR
jgi:hypothetical protein